MMTDTKDGGPAFPRIGDGFGNPLYDTPGMSLRDWFAGQALGKLNLLVANFDGQRDTEDPAEIAALAYRVADAMLAERAKP